MTLPNIGVFRQEHNALWPIWFVFREDDETYLHNGRTVASGTLEDRIKLSNLVIENGACVDDCRNLTNKMGNLLFLPHLYDIHIHTLTRLCDYFMRIGSDIEGRNHVGETPLLCSVCSRYYASARWLEVLIGKGADVTATANGLGPLHYLFRYSSPWVTRQMRSKAEILLQSGCDPHGLDHLGRTPAYHARRTSHRMLEYWRAFLTDLGFDAYGGLHDDYDENCSTDDEKESDSETYNGEGSADDAESDDGSDIEGYNED